MEVQLIMETMKLGVPDMLLEPIKRGDDLFPYETEIVDGTTVNKKRKDWNAAKQASLDLRAIEYLLQFRENEGHLGVIRMIDAWRPRILENGTSDEQQRFLTIVERRKAWPMTDI